MPCSWLNRSEHTPGEWLVFPGSLNTLERPATIGTDCTEASGTVSAQAVDNPTYSNMSVATENGFQLTPITKQRCRAARHDQAPAHRERIAGGVARSSTSIRRPPITAVETVGWFGLLSGSGHGKLDPIDLAAGHSSQSSATASMSAITTRRSAASPAAAASRATSAASVERQARRSPASVSAARTASDSLRPSRMRAESARSDAASNRARDDSTRSTH